MIAPKMVHLRLEADLVKELDYLTVEYDLYRTDLIEMMLEIGLDEIKSGAWDMKEIVEEFFEEDGE